MFSNTWEYSVYHIRKHMLIFPIGEIDFDHLVKRMAVINN